MSNSAIPTEPITADPVIVNPTDSESIETRLSKLEESFAAQNVISPDDPSRYQKRQSRSRERSPIIRTRFRSPPPPLDDLPILTNTTSLLSALAKAPEMPDMMVEIQAGPGRCNSSLAYLTSLPVDQAELEKISWVFKLAVEDCWSQKLEGSYRIEAPGVVRTGRGRVDYYEDRYEEQRYERVVGASVVVKLGKLFSTIFPTSTDDAGGNEEEEKVKFLSVIQGKGHYPPLKLITSYSKRGALVDLFHEVVNGYSVLFVGAILKDVDFVASAKLRRPDEEPVFKKVGSVAEAEKVDEGVFAVIC